MPEKCGTCSRPLVAGLTGNWGGQSTRCLFCQVGDAQMVIIHAASLLTKAGVKEKLNLRTPTALPVLKDVLEERQRQDEKWGAGSQNRVPDGTGGGDSAWLADQYKKVCQAHSAEGRTTFKDILLEEVYEALAESDLDKLRAELIQVAAVAVKWVEAIDVRMVEAGKVVAEVAR